MDPKSWRNQDFQTKRMAASMALVKKCGLACLHDIILHYLGFNNKLDLVLDPDFTVRFRLDKVLKTNV